MVTITVWRQMELHESGPLHGGTPEADAASDIRKGNGDE